MLRLLDIAVFLFHGGLIVFNLCGWLFRSTRRLHLIVISLTLSSWVGIGVFYGFGYCPLTDWHWRIKQSLGETNLPSSFFTYYLERQMGVGWDPGLVDGAVAVLGFASLFASIWMNSRLRDANGRRHRPFTAMGYRARQKSRR